MKWLDSLPSTCHILYLRLLLDWMWSAFFYWKWDCCQIRLRPVPSTFCSLFTFQLNSEGKGNRLKIVKWTLPENPESRTKFELQVPAFGYLSKRRSLAFQILWFRDLDKKYMATLGLNHHKLLFSFFDITVVLGGFRPKVTALRLHGNLGFTQNVIKR